MHKDVVRIKPEDPKFIISIIIVSYYKIISILANGHYGEIKITLIYSLNSVSSNLHNLLLVSFNYTYLSLPLQ